MSRKECDLWSFNDTEQVNTIEGLLHPVKALSDPQPQTLLL